MGQRKAFNRQAFKMANRGERIADGRVLDPIGMGMGRDPPKLGGTEWPNTPSCDPKAGQEAPSWVGSEAIYQSEHASSGQAGLLANRKQGLRGQERGRKLALGFG